MGNPETVVSVAEDPQWTAINKLSSQQNETSRQMSVLTRDVETIAKSVESMSRRFDTVISRIDQVERPDVNLWLKIAGLILALGTGLWAMAIRPVEQEIQSAKEERNQIRSTLSNGLLTTQDQINALSNSRWTEADAKAQSDYLREIMTQKIDALKEEIRAHESLGNHPWGVLHEVEGLRSEMYRSLGEHQRRTPESGSGN